MTELSPSHIDSSTENAASALRNIFKKGQSSSSITSVNSLEKKDLLSLLKPSTNNITQPAHNDISSLRYSSAVSSSPKATTFDLDCFDRNQDFSKSIQHHPISQFVPSSKDATDRVQVNATKNFIFYLLKDGKIRILSRCSGQKTTLKAEKSFFVEFSVNLQDCICASTKDGSIEIFSIAESSSPSEHSPVEKHLKASSFTSIAEEQSIRFSLLCRIVFSPEQSFFSNLNWHPFDENIITASGIKGDIYFLRLDKLLLEAKSTENRQITLHPLPNGSLSRSNESLFRIEQETMQKIESFSISPFDEVVSKVDSSAQLSIASYRKLNQTISTIPIPMSAPIELFWIPQSKLILCCGQGGILLCNFESGAVVYDLRLNTAERLKYSFDSKSGMLIISSTCRKVLYFFHVSSESAKFIGYFSLPFCPLTISLSPFSVGSFDIFLVHNHGVSYLTVCLENDKSANLSSSQSNLSDSLSDMYQFIMKNSIERQTETVRLINSTLSKNLPSFVEFAVKNQIETLIGTKLSAFIKSSIEDAVSKHTSQLKSEISQLNEKLTALTQQEQNLDHVRSAFTSIQSSLSALVDTLEKSSQNQPSELTSSTSQLKASSVASKTVTIQDEIIAFLNEDRIEDAFRRTLNLKNLPVLAFLCSKFDAESFFSTTKLSAPSLLSLIQQLSIELEGDCDEWKFRWMQEALLALDASDSVVCKHFHQLFMFVKEHLERFIQNSANDAGKKESLKQAKLALKIATNIFKNISK